MNRAAGLHKTVILVQQTIRHHRITTRIKTVILVQQTIRRHHRVPTLEEGQKHELQSQTYSNWSIGRVKRTQKSYDNDKNDSKTEERTYKNWLLQAMIATTLIDNKARNGRFWLSDRKTWGGTQECKMSGVDVVTVME